MTRHSALCFFAHPDDETIMIGGTLAMLHAVQVSTHVVCATRGEGGESGEPPVVNSQEMLGAAREAELRCAVATLGVTTLDLLGYIDPAVGPGNELGPFDADFDTLVGQFSARIAAVKPEVVIAHGPDGEYGHPAHKLIYRASLQAIRQHHPTIPFYSVAAAVPGIEDHLWNESRIAHFALDITPWSEDKIAAMACHKSQHALFKRRRKLNSVREALRHIESFYREWPATNGARPCDAFATLLLAAGATTPDR